MPRARAPSGPGKPPGLPEAAAGGDVTQSPKESARAQRQQGRSRLQPGGSAAGTLMACARLTPHFCRVPPS